MNFRREARRRRIHHLLLALTLAIVCTARCGIRDDELLCEEAAAQLDHCCYPATSTAQGRFHCSYAPGCIDQAPIYPYLGPETSECILSMECDQLSENDRCDAIREHLDDENDAALAVVLECHR